MLIKAGTVITLEQGEYSDFRYAGPFGALKDIDTQILVAKFRSKTRRKNIYDDLVDGFIAWLARNRYIEDRDCTRVFLGSHGDLWPTDYVSTAEDIRPRW